MKMSRMVVDVSVALKWVLLEPDSPSALLLRDDYRNRIHDLISPDIFPIEIANALAKLERRKFLKPPEGSQKLADILKTNVVLHSHLPLLPRAFDIASSMRIAIYDCVYVALAEKENCELVTADAKLIANLQKQFPFIKELASLP